MTKAKIDNPISNEWVTVKEAAKRSIYSTKQIYKHAYDKHIGSKKLPNEHVLFNMKDIIQYAANHHEEPLSSPVWGEITFLPNECFYPIIGYDCKYFISNKCRVINATNGRLLTPQPKVDVKGRLTGYQAVTLMQNEKPKNVSIHRLVGKTQCANVLNYDIFHHISQTKHNGLLNNKASNILPVPNNEVHRELHRLLNKNEKEYKKLVAKIKKDNRQRLYKIPHPDFASDDNFNYYMLLTTNGYKAYRNNQDIHFNDIAREIAELKKHDTEAE